MDRVRIAALGSGGDGIAEDGTFVPFAAPGDLVEVERDAKRGRLVRLVEEGADRTTPPCPHFGVCGGCRTQHIGARTYADWKRDLVVRALERTGISGPVDPLVDAHGAGRRRMTLHVFGGRAGYMARGTHDLMPVEVCPILSPALAKGLPFARELAALAPDAAFDLRLTATEGGVDADVRQGLRAGVQLHARMAALARAHGLARLTHGGETIAAIRSPSIAMGPVATVVLPPGAFLQATARGEDVLAGLALDAARRPKRVADLFCGLGPFALRFLPYAAVYAADAEADAIAALRKAAAVNGFKPLTAERRDLFRRPLLASELGPFDLVVMDPPYDGAAAQTAELARSAVPTIVSVSCNPATFARDAKALVAGGYRLERVTPVDQFRYAADVEVVGVFRR